MWSSSWSQRGRNQVRIIRRTLNCQELVGKYTSLSCFRRTHTAPLYVLQQWSVCQVRSQGGRRVQSGSCCSYVQWKACWDASRLQWLWLQLCTCYLGLGCVDCWTNVWANITRLHLRKSLLRQCLLCRLCNLQRIQNLRYALGRVKVLDRLRDSQLSAMSLLLLRDLDLERWQLRKP